MSVAFAFSENTDYQNTHIDPFLKAVQSVPRIAMDDTRRIYETVILKNGIRAHVVALQEDDVDAMYETSEAEYHNALHKGKSFMLRRSKEKLRKIVIKGDGVALVTEDGTLMGFGAVEPIADKEDMGRGNPYTSNGTCEPHQQTYFKAIVVHPDIQNYQEEQDIKLDIPKILYPHRLARALTYPNRTCLLTKTNNPKVKEAFVKNKWDVVDRFRVPEADLPDSTLTGDEVYLDTFFISCTDALNQLKSTYPVQYRTHMIDILKAHGIHLVQFTPEFTQGQERVNGVYVRSPAFPPVPFSFTQPS